MSMPPPSAPPSEANNNNNDDEDDDNNGPRVTVMAGIPVTLPRAPKRPKDQTPQETIDEFWKKFTTKAPGKATTVLPQNEYVDKAAKRLARPVEKTTQASYDEAAAVCRAKVDKIVKECRRVNQKYRDPHFDLELDLKWGKRDTLEMLCNVAGAYDDDDDDNNDDDSPKGSNNNNNNNNNRPYGSGFRPRSVKRVVDIFDEPKFYIDGPTANDVRQGRDGDCWLLAGLCTLSNKPSLIERLCVARDEQVGVYGFVFHRDGEWISEIIDDKLFLTKPDFDESFLERMLWEDRERVNSEEQYRRAYQSGSGALYFSQCEHANETWLPLLEKAYAKAHGDYAAIEGGYTGEAIEDLTGGVTSELYTTDILDKEYFWREELLKVNDEFLFGCSTGMWGVGWGDRKGIVELHAYSIMRAVEMDGQRLLLLKNPWGKGEWKGAWSDGSKEWTAEWLTKLDHRFGDDGAFWISYEDLLHKYQDFDRTRLFGPEWKVTACWTTLSVPWTHDYHDTYFSFALAKTGPVVLVLSQLDDRYYRGLEGQYAFELNFRLHRAGQQDYVVRSISPYCQTRSVNVELDLDAGEYTVLLKIRATRNMALLPIDEVIRANARDRRDKLVAVGMSYDLAHSRGRFRARETPEERASRKGAELRGREARRRALRRRVMKLRREEHRLKVKAHRKEHARRARDRKREQARHKKDQAKRRAARAKAKDKAKAREARAKERARAKGKGNKDDAKAEGGSGEKGEKDVAGSVAKTERAPEAEKQVEARAETAAPGGPKDLAAESTSEGSDNATPSTSDASKSDAEGAAKSSEADKPETKEGTSTEAKEEKPDQGQKEDDSEDDELDDDDDDDDDDESDDDDLSDISSESTVSDVSEISERSLDLLLERQLALEAARGGGGGGGPDGPRILVGGPGDGAGPGMPPPPPPGGIPGAEGEEEDEFADNPWNAVATVGLRVYYRVTDEEREDGASEIVRLRVVRPDPHRRPSRSRGKGKSKGSKEGEKDKDEKEKGKDEKTDKGKKTEKEKKDGEGGNAAKRRASVSSTSSSGSSSESSDEEEEGPEPGAPGDAGNGPRPGDGPSKGLDVDDSSKDATLVGDQEQRKKSILALRPGKPADD